MKSFVSKQSIPISRVSFEQRDDPRTLYDSWIDSRPTFLQMHDGMKGKYGGETLYERCSDA